MISDKDIEAIPKFVKTQRELIQIERDEEELQLRELLRDTKVKDLVQFGLCLNKLKIKKTKVGAFDKPIVVFRQACLAGSKKIEDFGDKELLEKLKFTNNQKFSRGDLVALYRAESSREKFSEKPLAVGSLEKVEDFSLTVVFNDSQLDGDIDFFSEDAENGMYCLVQTVNDVTYRR
jgi:hypothetical protein